MFTPPFLRTPFNYDMWKASFETAITCPEETLTQQQFLEDSDINTIANRFGLTGQLPENPQPPVYADFEDVFDYQTAQNAIVAANARFMAFPAHVRNRFSNDPQELMNFLADTANRDEAVKLGLVKASLPVVDAPVVDKPKDQPST